MDPRLVRVQPHRSAGGRYRYGAGRDAVGQFHSGKTAVVPEGPVAGDGPRSDREPGRHPPGRVDVLVQRAPSRYHRATGGARGNERRPGGPGPPAPPPRPPPVRAPPLYGEGISPPGPRAGPGPPG